VSDIPVINPRSVFTIKTLTATLSLKAGTVPRELRLRRLRFSKRAGRVFILGEWVLAWLASGEDRRPAAAVSGAPPRDVRK
jgi:hypothetical protein